MNNLLLFNTRLSFMNSSGPTDKKSEMSLPKSMRENLFQQASENSSFANRLQELLEVARLLISLTSTSSIKAKLVSL